MTQVAQAKVKISLEDKLTAPLKKIKADFVSLSKSLNFDRLTASTKKFNKSIRGIGDGLKASMGRFSGLRAVLGFGGGGLASSILDLSKSLGARCIELDTFSKRAGVSAETLQELQYAGKQFNITSDAMADGLAELNLHADEFAATGKGSGAEAFQALGYSANDLKKKLEDPSELFSEIIEKLGKMDKSTQISLTDELFGGSAGEQFMSMMGKTKQDIDDMRKEGRMNGGILGNDVVEEALKFQHNLDALYEKLGGIRDQIAAGLLPIMGDLVQEMKDWIDANRGMITSNIKKGLIWLKTILIDLKNPSSDLRIKIDDIKNSITNWYDRLKPLITFVGGPANAILLALGAYIGGPLIGSFLKAGIAAVRLGSSLTTSLITVAPKTIPALRSVIGTMGNLSKTMGRGLINVAPKTMPALRSVIGTAGTLSKIMAGGLIKALTLAGGAFRILGITILTTPVGWIIAGIAGLIAVGYLLYKNWDSVCSGISGMWDGLMSWLSGVFERISSAFDQGFIQGILTLLYEFNPLKIITDAINGIIEYFFGINLKDVGLNFISGFYDGVVEKLTALKKWLLEKIKSLTKYLPGWVQEKLGLKISTEETTKALESVKETIDSTTEIVDHTKSGAAVTPQPEKTTGKQQPEAEISKLDPKMQASQVQAEEFISTEPITGHEQQVINIDASVKQLVVNGYGGSPDDINQAVANALARRDAQMRRDTVSALSD